MVRAELLNTRTAGTDIITTTAFTLLLVKRSQPRAHERGGLGLKKTLELDSLRKLYYLHKGG